MISKKAFIVSALLALSVSFAAAANKPIYKWKDDQGNIKYTQSKPPRGTEFETIYQRQSNSSEQQSQSSRPTQSNTTDTQDQMIAAQESQQKSARQANKEILQKNCEIAKNNSDTLTNSPRVFTEIDGERRLLTDEERSSKLEAAQSNIDKYCK
ncbi:DUF4124 domain-containing protein [Kangiella sp. HD9-110m-PIT-SAG07]|nr:DUF4124 domain-containing protein [Kangiella sp. HD9-110m-PIT-SAG07]